MHFLAVRKGCACYSHRGIQASFKCFRGRLELLILFYSDSLCWRCFPWSSNQKSYPHKCRKALTFTCLFLISCVCLDFFVSALVLVPDGADQPGYAAVWLEVCLMWNTDSFCPASFDKRQCQVDTKKTSSTTQTRDEPQSSMASMSLQEWPSLNQIFMYNLTGVFCPWPCSCSDMCPIWFDVFFFSSTTASALPTSVSTTLQSTQPKLRRYSAPWVSSSPSSQA